MIATVQRIAFKAVITDGQKRVLLIREARAYKEGTIQGRWHVPGGRLGLGEPWQDGLKREVKEEVGLDIAIGWPLSIGEWFPTIKDQPHQIVAIFVACTAHTTRVKLGPDHREYIWLEAGKLADYDIMESDIKAINAYFAAAPGLKSGV
jgi:8-oxo-dGTP diphosphatase